MSKIQATGEFNHECRYIYRPTEEKHHKQIGPDGSITFTCGMSHAEAMNRVKAAYESGGKVTFAYEVIDHDITHGSTTFQLGSQENPDWSIVADFNNKIPGFKKKNK